MKTKLFVVYHSNNEPINDEIYQSIAVGENVDSFSDSFLKDNTGKNISNLNHFYNELTAIYWVYTHLNEFKDIDNFGFVHYRRFFIFNECKKYVRVKKTVGKDMINVSNDQISEMFKDSDFAVPFVNSTKSVSRHYEKAHPGFELSKVKEIIGRIKPEYLEIAEKYFSGNQEFLYNMFIFPKDIFVKYCEFVFPVLEEILKTSEANDRLYISERLTGIFIAHLIESGETPHYLPILFVRNKDAKKGFKDYKKNSKEHKEYGFVYKLKPLWLNLIPKKLEEALRNRTRKDKYIKH